MLFAKKHIPFMEFKGKKTLLSKRYNNRKFNPLNSKIMANININSSGREKRNKPKKQNLRVDFTPMVDMNMLLITFFMFCTTLSLPQVVDIIMPIDDMSNRTESPESKSLTVILGEDDKVYYYHGKPNYEDYTQLHEASYRDIRNVMLEKNSNVYTKIKDLRKQLVSKQITKETFDEKTQEVKRSSETITVMIKPTKESLYRNLVEMLDEIQICGVGKYAIMNLEEADKFVLENLKTKGQLTAMAGAR